MKLLIGELAEARESLEKLLGTDLPLKLAYKLRKVARETGKQLVDFEEQRMRLVRKYGRQGEGNEIRVDPTNTEVFANEMRQIMAIGIEINCEPISMAELEEHIKLSAFDMARLEKFLVL